MALIQSVADVVAALVLAALALYVGKFLVVWAEDRTGALEALRESARWQARLGGALVGATGGALVSVAELLDMMSGFVAGTPVGSLWFGFVAWGGAVVAGLLSLSLVEWLVGSVVLLTVVLVAREVRA